MAMIRSDIENSIKGKAGSGGYTLSGSTATITGNLSDTQLKELIDHAIIAHHDVKVVSGAVTLSPRS